MTWQNTRSKVAQCVSPAARLVHRIRCTLERVSAALASRSNYRLVFGTTARESNMRNDKTRSAVAWNLSGFCRRQEALQAKEWAGDTGGRHVRLPCSLGDNANATG